MAHFARVKDGVVQEVVVVDNKDCAGGDFPDSETVGQEFLASLPHISQDGVWLQTSYNRQFRYWFASTGMLYDAEGDAFYSDAPGADWTLDRVTFQWVSSFGRRLPSL